MKKLLVMTTVLGLVQLALGQGSLLPPGAPAPSMKTLDQIEPRIASLGSNGFGVSAGSGSSISGCTVYRNGGTTANSAGIFTLFDSAIYDCSVTQNTNHGIRVAGGSSVRDNQVNKNGNVGIEAVQEGSVIERNHLTGNLFGISVVSSNNVIAANRVSSASVSNNYAIATGNAYGPIVNVTGAGDVSFTPNADHPLANLSY